MRAEGRRNEEKKGNFRKMTEKEDRKKEEVKQ